MQFYLPEFRESEVIVRNAPESLETPTFNSLMRQLLSVEAPPSSLRGNVIEATADERKLFDNRAELKIVTSQVSMHLSKDQRDDLFQQLDELLDIEAWGDDSSLISPQSYRTFLRFLIYWRGVRRPALTVSSAGNLMASWVQPGKRLTIEYMLNDIIRAVVYKAGVAPEVTETNAYLGPIKRLDAVLEPFEAVIWYRNVWA